MTVRGSRFWMFVAVCALLTSPLRAGDLPALPAAGKLLVATSNMPDPDFAQAVVLLFHSDERGVVGLLINRPTEMPLVHLFPELKDALAGKAPVYLGGLVAQGARGLLRVSEKDSAAPKTALRVFGSVVLISDASALEKLAAGGARPDTFRVYAGYTGWAADQLRAEMKLGCWTVADPSEKLVFDAHPETMWKRLTQPMRQAQNADALGPPAR